MITPALSLMLTKVNYLTNIITPDHLLLLVSQGLTIIAGWQVLCNLTSISMIDLQA
jgi:hypothetical protein